eukprot:264087_1
MADSTQPTIDEHEFKDFLDVIKSAPNDKERMRRVRATQSSYRFTTNQVASMLVSGIWDSEDGRIAATLHMLEAISDIDKIGDIVALFKFKEDKDKITEKIQSIS